MCVLALVLASVLIVCWRATPPLAEITKYSSSTLWGLFLKTKSTKASLANLSLGTATPFESFVLSISALPEMLESLG
jgi:hypothetical protein